MSDPLTILIVDDEENIRETVRFALEKAGFRTAEAGDGREALELYGRVDPALVVLDILMPELDGTEVCRAIRRQNATPIIFLTSKDDEVDRIVGLELGGDDYVPKPFSPRELVARVRAVLRRTRPVIEVDHGPDADASPILEHGLLKLDTDGFRAYWDKMEVGLTATEFNILRTLMRHPGKVYSRDALMDGAYADESYVSDRTIDSHIRNIRHKLGPAANVVETVHGLGYRLGACDAPKD